MTVLTYTTTQFLKLMRDLLGDDEFEALNRKFVAKHGFSGDDLFVLRMRAHMANQALIALNAIPHMMSLTDDEVVLHFPNAAKAGRLTSRVFA